MWGGFLLTALGSAFCIPWGPDGPPLAPELFTEGLGAGETPGGCPASAQPWCSTTRALRLPQFLIGYASVSLGYPLGVTLIQTIFSKIIGPRPQVLLVDCSEWRVGVGGCGR